MGSRTSASALMLGLRFAATARSWLWPGGPSGVARKTRVSPAFERMRMLVVRLTHGVWPFSRMVYPSWYVSPARNSDGN
jgi:hypothetical protein